jgi:glycosyltransferase involved in cell wall biosynthesis
MYRDTFVSVIIPALNEESSIRRTLADLPPEIDEIIVCDNGSSDNTKAVAQESGATVVSESQRGYGAACLKAVASVSSRCDILLFIDADYSDYPEEAPKLLDPIIDNQADMVIGSRTRTPESRAALTPVARFGNLLSTSLIRRLWDVQYTDLGPFRAIRYEAYQSLDMTDRGFGWTVEMQIRAAKRGLAGAEVPVSYRQRIGTSKISGTISGSVKAGAKILYLIGREALSDSR